MTWEELINTTATLAGGAIGAGLGTKAGAALGNPAAGVLISGCLSVTGSYVGNLAYNTPSEDRIKEKIHDCAINALTSQGISKTEAEKEFLNYHPLENPPKASVGKNFGNILTTSIGGSIGTGVGLLSTTALCTALGKGIDLARGGGNKAASYGFVVGMLSGPILGKLAGGYAGNKFFSDPDKKYLEQEADTFAKRILEERKLRTQANSPHLPTESHENTPNHAMSR